MKYLILALCVCSLVFLSSSLAWSGPVERFVACPETDSSSAEDYSVKLHDVKSELNVGEDDIDVNCNDGEIGVNIDTGGQVQKEYVGSISQMPPGEEESLEAIEVGEGKAVCEGKAVAWGGEDGEKCGRYEHTIPTCTSGHQTTVKSYSGGMSEGHVDGKATYECKSDGEWEKVDSYCDDCIAATRYFWTPDGDLYKSHQEFNKVREELREDEDKGWCAISPASREVGETYSANSTGTNIGEIELECTEDGYEVAVLECESGHATCGRASNDFKVDTIDGLDYQMWGDEEALCSRHVGGTTNDIGEKRTKSSSGPTQRIPFRGEGEMTEVCTEDGWELVPGTLSCEPVDMNSELSQSCEPVDD